MSIQPIVLTTPSRDVHHVRAICDAFSRHDAYARPMVYNDIGIEGAARATREALRRAGAAGSHVLFMEDDVIVDGSAPASIAETLFPDEVGVISFCDMREVPEFARDGLYPRSAMGSDGLGWWGNQALLIHRDTVAVCLNHDWFSPQIEQARGIRVHKITYEDEGRNCSDIRMALVIDRFGGDRRLYAVSVPSLFKHVGHESVCFPGRGMGERETRNWIGARREFGLLGALAAQPAPSP